MPRRRDWTLEEFQAREERRREQTRLRVARYRARKALQVRVTASSRNGTVTGTPPHPPSLLSLYEREREEIARALEPLAPRGYVHDPRFWDVAREQYPQLCLELEALKLADWLQEPRNARRRCSKAFLDNWLKKAEADRLIREATQAAGTTSVHYGSPNGAGGNGVYHQPQSQQHNRQPDAPRFLEGDLERIDPHKAGREMAARRALPLEQRLAALKGGKR